MNNVRIASRRSVLVNPAADEFTDQGIIGDKILADIPEQQQGGKHIFQLFKALNALFGGKED